MARTSNAPGGRAGLKTGAQVPVDALHEAVVPAGAALATHGQAHRDDHELVRQALAEAADRQGQNAEGNNYPAGVPYSRTQQTDGYPGR